jgi:hypothetical protein
METPKTIDYKVKASSDSRYRYLRIPLNNLVGPVVLNAASQLLEWKLPSVVYNLSRSYIQYGLRVPAAANNSNWTFEDLSLGELAASVQFGSAGGVNLVDVQYLGNFLKPTIKALTPAEELESRDVVNSVYHSNLVGNVVLGLHANPAGSNNLLNTSYAIQAGNIYGLTPNAGGNPSYLSPFKVSDTKYTVSTAVNTELSRPRQIRLSDCKKTLLELDRNDYYPIEMYLRINTNSINKMAFRSTDPADPAAAGANYVALDQANLENCVLYLAVEQNQEIVDELINSVKSGAHKYQIPFTVGHRHVLPAGLGAVQIPMTSQYGRKISDITFTVANAAENGNTCYDTNNWNGSKIQSYQTYLDNRQLQDSVLSCVQPSIAPAAGQAGNGGDDWRENRKHCINKQLCYGQYQFNWFHTDSFRDDYGEGLELGNKDQGLDMEAVRLYQIAPTVGAGGCTIYTFITYLRHVMVDPNGGNILFG